jgi:hypothetical protein
MASKSFLAPGRLNLALVNKALIVASALVISPASGCLIFSADFFFFFSATIFSLNAIYFFSRLVIASMISPRGSTLS